MTHRTGFTVIGTVSCSGYLRAALEVLRHNRGIADIGIWRGAVMAVIALVGVAGSVISMAILLAVWFVASAAYLVAALVPGGAAVGGVVYGSMGRGYRCFMVNVRI